ncbi:MAG: transposase [Nitrospirales bacterium]|nr:transposase [Nitrospirales bacterium]
MEQRRRFFKEFKHEAVKRAAGANLAIKQVAATLSLHVNVRSRWCREQKREGVSVL